MSEFERRKRYLKYSDPECASFLRKDFDHKCAYCLIKEADQGGPNNYEKDHFVPQKGGHIGMVHAKYSGEDFDVDSYYNLYYSCSRCNGRSGKSNTWSSTLLDPCKDKIWDEHIQLNGDLVKPNTPQGEEYIATFQLNSRSARSLRIKIKSKNEDIIKQINELKGWREYSQGNKAFEDYLNKAIEEEEAKLKYGIRYISNDYFYNDEEIKEAESVLSKYQLDYADGDFELDYEIVLDNEIYKVYLRTHASISFTNGEKTYYLPINQVEDWQDKKVLVCHFDSESKKLYYINFNEFLNGHPISTENRYKYFLEERQVLQMLSF